MKTPFPIPSPPDWPRCLRPGMRIHLPSGAGCPAGLVHSLIQEAKKVGDLELIHGSGLTEPFWASEELSHFIKTNVFHLDSRLENQVNAGHADYTPAHDSDIPKLIAEGSLRIDVALVHLSPPDAFGYCSMGPAIGWTPTAIQQARLVVAQINPKIPRTSGQSHLHVSRIHYAIELEEALPELMPQPIDAPTERIGAYAAQLVNDGDCLQFGTGPIGTSLANSLHRHRFLGIHAEAIGGSVMRLFEAGAVDNSRKTLVPGKIVCSHAVGDSHLYLFLNDNPHFDFRPTSFVNDPLTIARNTNMVAVNTALLCDVTGQIVTDSYEGRFRGGVGSVVDFIRGSAMSPGGRPVIALPSTGIDEHGNRFSRIVASLPRGAGVACHRSDVFYVVTEFGIATLRGRTIQDRIKELIQIAHPDFREHLLRGARDHHLLPPWFQVPPISETALHGVEARRLELKDRKPYLLRPLTPADDRRLQEFFYSHTEETILRRYGFTITRMSRERAFELVGIDQGKDLALGIFELQGPRQVIHAVGRFYLDTDPASAEMAFVVSEEKRRLGMARVLLQRMIEVADDRKLQKLWASVDRDNIPMIGLFRQNGAVEVPDEDPHTVQIEISIGNA